MSVVVFGSANVDLVVSVDRHPFPGETVPALGRPRIQAGGKGVNQAVAAQKSTGHSTTFIGAVGIDPDGEIIRRTLESNGIVAALRSVAEVATGTSIIAVDRAAENMIIVVAGANDTLLSASETEANLLRSADVALFQGEIPPRGFESAAGVAREAGASIILNAAPAWKLSPMQLELVDVLIVNESESRAIAEGVGIDSESSSPEELCNALALIVPAVAMTLGSAGAVWAAGGSSAVLVPAPRVIAIDTTGAGDTFCGVVAGSLAEGFSLADAIDRGVHAAAVAVTRVGASDAVPDLAELDRSMSQRFTDHGAAPRPTQKGI